MSKIHEINVNSKIPVNLSRVTMKEVRSRGQPMLDVRSCLPRSI